MQMGTSDLASIAWSPDGQRLAAWDAALQYKALLFARNGDAKGSYSAYQDALGIVGGAWDARGHMLALGSCDQVSSDFQTNLLMQFSAIRKLSVKHSCL